MDGGGSSGYHYEAYFRLKGEFQISIGSSISFSKPGESNYFTLNQGNGGGYGTAKLHYAGGSAPTMTKRDNISEILEKEITSTSQGGNGYTAGNLGIKILGREWDRGESGVNGYGRDYIDYSIYGDSGFEFIYSGKFLPVE